MKKKMIRDSVKGNGGSIENQKMLYFFRTWAKLTNIETTRYKQHRARETIKRI